MHTHKTLEKTLRSRLHEQAPGAVEELETIESGTGLFTLLAASFKGKQAWVMGLLYGVGGLAFIGLCVFGNAYLSATAATEKLDWALGVAICLSLFFLVKIIGFAMLAKTEVLRELKRVELRIVLLDAALNKNLKTSPEQ